MFEFAAVLNQLSFNYIIRVVRHTFITLRLGILFPVANASCV